MNTITKFFDAEWGEVKSEVAAYAVRLTFDGDKLVTSETFFADGVAPETAAQAKS